MNGNVFAFFALAFFGFAAFGAVPPIGTDIIQNGGFESGSAIITYASGSGNNGIGVLDGSRAKTDGWITKNSANLATGATAFSIPTTFYAGSTYCVLIQGEGSIQQRISVPVAGQYELSMRYQRRSTGGSQVQYLTASINGITLFPEAATSGTTEGRWTPTLIALEAGVQDLVISAYRPSGDVTIFIDDVSLVLKRYGSTEGVRLGDEVMTNGGFEEDSSFASGYVGVLDGVAATTKGWRGNGKLMTASSAFSPDSVPFINGRYCVGMQQSAILSNTFEIAVSARCKLTYRYRRREASGSQWYTVKIDEQAVVDDEVSTGTEVKTREVSGIELVPGVHTIEVSTRYTSGDVTTFFDDFSLLIEEIHRPEPIVEVMQPTVAIDNVMTIAYWVPFVGADAETVDVAFAYGPAAEPLEDADYALIGIGLQAGEYREVATAKLKASVEYRYDFRFTNDQGISTNLTGTFTAHGMMGSGGTMMLAKDGSGDVVHVFDAAGDYEFTAPTSDVDIRVLIVGGGGGGGVGAQYYGGGAGGGGGVYTNLVAAPITVAGSAVCRVSVGAGAVRSSDTGLNGEDSSLTVGADTYVAKGGGGGGKTNTGVGQVGGNGGGGGSGKAGGAGNQVGYDATGMLTTVGRTGGNGVTCGGGGGAGAAVNGTNGNGYIGGAGGSGVMSDITGAEVYYAGGGSGGSRDSNSGVGGVGGGGLGSGSATPAGDGADGFGGGGGGGSGAKTAADRSGGAGGCGCVIIRYHPTESKLHSTFAPVEKNYASIRFSGLLDCVGKVGDRCDLSVSMAPANQELGEFRLLQRDWMLDTEFTYDWVGLEPLTAYRYAVKLENHEEGSLVAVTNTVVTTGTYPMVGDENRQMADGTVLHVFRRPQTFETFTLHADTLRLLVLGGGGGGGGGGNYSVIGGGGGGGGGLLEATVPVADGASCVVTVGAGGIAGNNANGVNGGTSTLLIDGVPYVGLGGGGGQSYGRGAAPTGGGNSGGVQHASMAVAPACQTNLSGEVIGHVGAVGSGWRGGNGGGAGGDGRAVDSGSGSSFKPRGGGFGLASDITGEAITYGGGGGGGAGNSGATVTYLAQGFDGGGDGGTDSLAPTAGENGRGGGGGGAYKGSGANGGNGLVAIRYQPTQSEDLTVAPYGNLLEIALKDVKAKGDATNVVEEISYRVWWAGQGEDYADVSLVYGASPDALTKEKLLAKNVIGSGTGVCKLTQSWKEGREYYVALKITSSAGTMVTEPVQVSLPKRITPQFPAVMVR